MIPGWGGRVENEGECEGDGEVVGSARHPAQHVYSN